MRDQSKRREYFRKYRKEHPEKCREGGKKYYYENRDNLEYRKKRSERFKDWCSRNKEKVRQYQRERYARDREKLLCRSASQKMVKNGSIKPKKKCERCSSSIRIERHHKDYKHPEKITFLCSECHRKEHRK